MVCRHVPSGFFPIHDTPVEGIENEIDLFYNQDLASIEPFIFSINGRPQRLIYYAIRRPNESIISQMYDI